MKAAQRPTRVVYGRSAVHDCLYFCDEARLRLLRGGEVAAVKRCTTVAEAMELARTVTLTFVLGVPDDVDELQRLGLQPTDRYDWSHTGEVSDGDWPPMLTALSLATFEPGDVEAWELITGGAVGARVETTVLNGDYLYIPVDREEALVAAFDRLGVDHERDDEIAEEFEDLA